MITMPSASEPRWLTPVPPESIERGFGGKVIKFAEAFGMITKDSVAGRAGSRLHLRDWQKALIEHTFASDDGESYRHRLALWGLPRKSGKSSLGSVVALHQLILGPRGGEVYSVAAEKEQARIVFSDARRTVENSEELSSLTKVYRDAIEVPEDGSVYRVLSAEAYSKEGLNPHFVLFDELHAQPNRDLFDVMSLATGARQSPMMLCITTAGQKSDNTGRDSVAFELYQYGQKSHRGEIQDSTYFMAWWESDGDHRLEETWREANPGFGDLSAPSDFESAVRRTPESEFRTKRCNQWVSTRLSWLPAGAWEDCAGEVDISPDDEIVLGFDGSFSGDCTVITGAIIPKAEGDPVKTFLVKAWEKTTEDDDDWRVDIADVENTILQFCQKHPKVVEVACDPFRWQRSMEVLQDKGVPISEYPSTAPRRMVASCAKLFDMVTEKRLVNDGDPLVARHFQNAVVKVDNLGPRIVKEARHSPRRIDAAVSTIIAVDRATVARMEQIVPEFFG